MAQPKKANTRIRLQNVIDPLTVGELEAGMRLIIKHMQAIYFMDELVSIRTSKKPIKQGPLQHLSPIIDDELIRVTGRLNLALEIQYQFPENIFSQEFR